MRAGHGGHWKDQREEDTVIPSPRLVLKTVNQPSTGKYAVWTIVWNEKSGRCEITESCGTPKEIGEGTPHLTWAHTAPSHCCQVI